MPHAKPRVPVLFDVVLWAAEPADEEERKTFARLTTNAPLLIKRMGRRERGFVALHHVVESLRERQHDVSSAEYVIG